MQCLAERYTDVYGGSQANKEVGLSVILFAEVIIVGLLLIRHHIISVTSSVISNSLYVDVYLSSARLGLIADFSYSLFVHRYLLSHENLIGRQ